MAKWKAPADAGPGVSVGGQFFPIVDGFVTTPSGDYADALGPFGYEQVDDSGDPPPPVIEAAPVTEPAAPEPVAEPAAVVEPAAPEAAPAASPEPEASPAAPVEG